MSVRRACLFVPWRATRGSPWSRRVQALALERAVAWGKSFSLILLDAKMPHTDGLTVATRIKYNPKLTSPIILMLSPTGQLEEAARGREIGVAAFLTKPVRQSDLFDAMVSALGKKGVQRTSAKRLLPRVSSRPARIVLTEDHPINQRLAIKLLTKWGHTVVVAENGRKALEILEKDPFDLVLMDLQMPEMDGLEATKLIRQKEKATQEHIPIIAMTAHAMKKDREECLEAGMDGYVTKPLDAKILFETIERIYSPRRELAPVALRTEPKRWRVDREGILARVEGDTTLLKEVTHLFLEDAPKVLARIKESIRRNDPKMLERAAHSLKGCISNFGATEACAAALELEVMGRKGDLTRVIDACNRLERAFNELLPELEAFAVAEAA